MDTLLVLGAIVAASLAGLAVTTRVLVYRAERRAPRLGETLVVDGVPLHFTDTGSGPPVVFLHGAKGSVYDAAALDRPGARPRAPRRRVRPPGRRLQRARRRRSGSPLVQAELLHLALRALGIAARGRRGPLGRRARGPRARSGHPADVAAVVTLGGYMFSIRDPARAPNRLLTLPVLGALVRWTVVVPLGHLLSGVVLRHVFAPDPPDPAYARLAPGLALRPARMPATLATCPTWRTACAPWPPRYAELGTPVVAVHGLADRVVSAAQAVRLCRARPARATSSCSRRRATCRTSRARTPCSTPSPSPGAASATQPAATARLRRPGPRRTLRPWSR